MFVIYNNTTKIIMLADPGNRLPEQYPYIDWTAYSYLDTTDDAAVIANSGNYYVDNAGPFATTIRSRNHLSLTASAASIDNDGVDQLTLTAEYLDINNRKVSSVWKTSTFAFPVTANINCISSPTSLLSFMVGDYGRVYRTIDGGATWSSVMITPYNLYSVHFINQYEGIIGGANGKIFYTSNGGSNWVERVSGTTDDIYAVHAYEDSPTSRSWWAVGESGLTLYSGSANALTWVSKATGNVQDQQDVKVLNLTTVIVVGNGGTIYYTTDTGTSWSPLTSGTAINLLSVDCTPNRLCGSFWVAMQNGHVLRSIDGGVTWVDTATVTTSVLNSIVFADAMEGRVVGGAGEIWHTTDGGSTWEQETSGTTEDLQSICLVTGSEKNRASICGNTGTVLFSKRVEAIINFNTSLVDTNGVSVVTPIITINGSVSVPFTTRSFEATLSLQVSSIQVYDSNTSTIEDDTTTIISDEVVLTVNQVAATVPTPETFTMGKVDLDPAVNDITGVCSFGQYLYWAISGGAIHKVVEFDTTTNTFTGKEYDCGLVPIFLIETDPLGTCLYVTLTGGGINKFDRASMALLGTLFPATVAAGIKFNTSGSKYYVVDQTLFGVSHSILVIDTATDAIIKTITDANVTTPYVMELAGDYLYFTDIIGGGIGCFSTITDAFITLIAPTCTLYQGLRYDGDHTVYVGAKSTVVGYVTIDTNTNTMSDFIPFRLSVVDHASPWITCKDGMVIFGSYANAYVYIVGRGGYVHELRIPGVPNPRVVASVASSSMIYTGCWNTGEPFAITWFTLTSFNSTLQGVIGNGNAGPMTFLEQINGSNGFITDHDVEITDSTKGVILRDPNGLRWRLTIDIFGAINTAIVP